MNIENNTDESKSLGYILIAILGELSGASYLQRKWDKIKHPSLKQRLKFLITFYILAIFYGDVIAIIGISLINWWVLPNIFIAITLSNLVALLFLGFTWMALVIKDKKRIQ